MSRHETELTFDRFESLVDSYGAEFGRWPAGEAGRARTLLAASGEARRLLDEAKALEALLAAAPTPAPDRLSALADRIVAAAVPHAQPGSEARPAGAKIIALPSAGRRSQPAVDASSVTVPSRVAPRQAPTPSRGPWRAAAALAASLLLGVAIGMTDIAPTSPLGLASLMEPASSDAEIAISGLQLDEDQI